jgi:hypothetical protein
VQHNTTAPLTHEDSITEGLRLWNFPQEEALPLVERDATGPIILSLLFVCLLKRLGHLSFVVSLGLRKRGLGIEDYQ